MPTGELESYFRGKVSREGYDLFAVFARFEYAMKRGGFRKVDRADAAWWTFADEMPATFFEAMKKAPEAAPLFTAPPRHLVCDGPTEVDWSNAPGAPRNTLELFEYVKIVRNNLLHGDKRHDVDRDNELSRASLFVLNAAYDAVATHPAFTAFIGKMELGL